MNPKKRPRAATKVDADDDEDDDDEEEEEEESEEEEDPTPRRKIPPNKPKATAKGKAVPKKSSASKKK